MLAITDHSPVCGSQISAARMAPAALLSGELLPPLTSTVPSAKIVPFTWRRPPPTSEPVYCHVGVAAFISIVSAVLVGASCFTLLPPTIKIWPGAYITDVPASRFKPWLVVST
jgi:capsular polysaccharide biosynthesis protein